MTHPNAGKRAPLDELVNIPALVSAYYTLAPDAREPGQRVKFGTSGHRGSALKRSFNDAHIAAIAQAVCEVRAANGVTGPLYLGIDTHALSTPAKNTALEVFAANGVTVLHSEGYTPTPLISHAILTHNALGESSADGVVITPSHNPPADGGFKYNPPHGGPAEGAITKRIETRANELLVSPGGIQRMPLSRALQTEIALFDFEASYADTLGEILDMEAIAKSGLKIGVDPLGGSGLHAWEVIAERWGLSLDLVNREIDPRFAFMRCDHDGKIRMDCSSRFAMAGLLELKDRFDLAFGNDTDFDRHGIVTPQGLMNPNHVLSVAVDYLFETRDWGDALGVGKTVVTSGMIDRVAKRKGLTVVEVPVGFKHFVSGLFAGSLAFGGEESAGASFVRKNGAPFSTDKDGLLMNLLAAEITAKTGKNPAEHYAALSAELGAPVYARDDAPASLAQKAALKALDASAVDAKEIAGEAVLSVHTHAPGNGEAIGGLKVTTENAWFALRPSGTEEIYKIYAESFRGEAHLVEVKTAATELVKRVLPAE